MGNNNKKYGFKYDDQHTDNYNMLVLQRFRNAGPAKENHYLTIPYRAGALPVRVDNLGKNIAIEFTITGEDPEDLREKLRDLAEWLQPELDNTFRPVPKELIFNDDNDKRWLAYLATGIELEEKGNRAFGSMAFFAPVPYMEALETKETGATGENTGTVEAPPFIIVTMTESSNDLKIEYNDKMLLLDQQLETGDVVKFDTEKRLVLVNDVDARGDLTYTSRWFNLKPGSFEITSTPAATIVVEFRERWL